MHSVLVPIFICVVLPVAIVLIICLTAMNGENRRAQVLIKAIESGNDIDTDRLADALKKPQRSARELLNLRLLRGCIFGLIGVSLELVGVVGICSGLGFEYDQVSIPMIIGAPLLAVGLSYIIVYFVTRNQD